MAQAVDGVHVYSTEQDINQLAAHHFEDQNLLQGKWNSEVDTLKETQRKEYREWLMKMLEEHQTNVTLPTPMYANRTCNGFSLNCCISLNIGQGFVFDNSCTEKQEFSYS
jgi:hypothetical protein